MHINIEKSVKRGIQVNDIFKVDEDFFMLVKTNHGYSLSSLSNNLFLDEEGSELTTLDDVENFIVKVEEFHEFEYYSKNIYSFELNIKSR